MKRTAIATVVLTTSGLALLGLRSLDSPGTTHWWPQPLSVAAQEGDDSAGYEMRVYPERTPDDDAGFATVRVIEDPAPPARAPATPPQYQMPAAAPQAQYPQYPTARQMPPPGYPQAPNYPQAPSYQQTPSYAAPSNYPTSSGAPNTYAPQYAEPTRPMPPQQPLMAERPRDRVSTPPSAANPSSWPMPSEVLRSDGQPVASAASPTRTLPPPVAETPRPQQAAGPTSSYPSTESTPPAALPPVPVPTPSTEPMFPGRTERVARTMAAPEGPTAPTRERVAQPFRPGSVGDYPMTAEAETAPKPETNWTTPRTPAPAPLAVATPASRTTQPSESPYPSTESTPPPAMADRYPATSPAPIAPPSQVAAAPENTPPTQPTAPAPRPAPQTAATPAPSFWSNNPSAAPVAPQGLPMENWQQAQNYREEAEREKERQRQAQLAAAPPQEDTGIRAMAFSSTELQTDLGPGEVLDAQIVARVDNEIILASEVLPQVEIRIAAARKQGAPESVIQQARTKLIKQLLDQIVERKILFIAAKRGLPDGAMPLVEEQLTAAFEERLDQMIVENKLADRAALEQQMSKQGMTIGAQKQLFIETMLGRQWMQQAVAPDELVTRAELLNWYHQHRDEYAFDARVKYRELYVNFNKVGGREAAYQKMAELGNRVVMNGEPFEQVAKTGSQGSTSSNGGERDWITQGSLTIKELDQALFTQPVGQPGRIIEAPDGLYIVQVVERQDAGFKDFRDTQKEIRDKIIEERRKVAETEYLEALRKRSTVWTIFDGEDPTRPQMASEPTAALR